MPCLKVTHDKHATFVINTGVNHNESNTGTITAFLGRSFRGPVNISVTLSSYGEYRRIFGGWWQFSTMSYAVEQYFEYGGNSVIVVRSVNGATSTTIELPCGQQMLVLESRAVGSREFLCVSVEYDNLFYHDSDYFNLVI